MQHHDMMTWRFTSDIYNYSATQSCDTAVPLCLLLQECKLQFGSWGYDGTGINLLPYIDKDNPADTSDYQVMIK